MAKGGRETDKAELRLVDWLVDRLDGWLLERDRDAPRTWPQGEMEHQREGRGRG